MMMKQQVMERNTSETVRKGLGRYNACCRGCIYRYCDEASSECNVPVELLIRQLEYELYSKK